MRDWTIQGGPCYPADNEQFYRTLWTYRNWHPEDAEGYLSAFPWPKPGEVPSNPGLYFVPTEKEKAKI